MFRSFSLVNVSITIGVVVILHSLVGLAASNDSPIFLLPDFLRTREAYGVGSVIALIGLILSIISSFMGKEKAFVAICINSFAVVASIWPVYMIVS
jgi:hypothetical protein